MNCEECQDFLDAYLDDELDAAATISVERHLRDCPDCRQLSEARQGLRALLDEPQLRFEVPEALRAKVLASLPSVKPRVPRSLVIPWFSIPWAVAAALVLALGLAFFNQGGILGRSPDQTLVRQVISSHVRSLLATHLLDVPSTDQHTVKPWLAGKLEFSPPVQDFAERGFSLIGGRLDYVNGRDVAALVYRRNKHLINLFIWPSEPGRAASVQDFAENGFNALHWDQGGFSFWAVSDVRKEELQALADLERQQL